MNVKTTLKNLGLFYSSRLSQNFLNSQEIAERIVDLSHVSPEDVVLEIGAGLGILTRALEKRANKVITFELDKRWIPHLESSLQFRQRTEIIPKDFLKYDLRKLKERFPQVKIVANLPFHLSTEIMFRLFEHRKWIDSMTLMFQKEVAERIVARPNCKAYGVLSVLSQLYSSPKILFSVPPHFFYPAPKVWASMIHFKMNPKLVISERDEDCFIKLIKSAFGQRRKTLYNALQKTVSVKVLKKLLEAPDTVLKRRAETLSLEEFKTLFEMIESI